MPSVFGWYEMLGRRISVWRCGLGSRSEGSVGSLVYWTRVHGLGDGRLGGRGAWWIGMRRAVSVSLLGD